MSFWGCKADRDSRPGKTPPRSSTTDSQTPPMKKTPVAPVEQKSKKVKGKKSKMQKGLAAMARPVNKLKAVTKNAKSKSLETANVQRVVVEKPPQSIKLTKPVKTKTNPTVVGGANQTQTLDKIKKAVAVQQEEAKAKASAVHKKNRSESCENPSMTAMTSEQGSLCLSLKKTPKSVKPKKSEAQTKKVIAETQLRLDALRKANNERENKLFRRLAAITDDDCGLPELKQRVGILKSMVKRTGHSMHDQTDLFIGCLNKSSEYLSIITQYRRMQSHKMTLLLDHADEECKRTNQLLEEHFQNLDCVYQLMRPDASSLELLGAVFRRWSRSLRTQKTPV